MISRRTLLKALGAAGVVGPAVRVGAEQVRVISGACAAGGGGGGTAYRDLILSHSPSNYWRLNESTGTVAADSAGSAPGTISGGVTLAQPGALADGTTAMAFDGTTGGVAAAAITIPATATVELWVKPVGLGSKQSFGLADNAFDLGVGANTGEKPYIYTGTQVWGTRPGIDDGAWHHLVYVLTGATVAIYLDGTFDVSGSNLRGSFGAVGATIGRHPNVGVFWRGGLDDVAIYPRALTPTEIAQHHAVGRAGSFAAGSYPAAVVNSGPSNYWRLGESSGLTAVDVIGAKNGTLQGGVTLNQPGAITDSDKAMLFNGTTGLIAITGISLPIPCTVEVWGKFAPGVYQAAFSTRGSPNGFMLGVTDGAVICYSDDAVPSQVGSGPISFDTWHHLVLVVNSTTVSLYIDGAFIGTVAQTHGVVTNAGARISDVGNGNAWNGLIDEVALYPRALSGAEVLDHYTRGITAQTSCRPTVVKVGG